MIEIKTNYPIATDSLDHLYPEGVYHDNNVSITFVEELENLCSFTKNVTDFKMNFLDLGCAGGALSVTMHERGHKSIGIDGSDGCINISPEVFNHFGRLPYGYENWSNYYNKVLFTCDVTKEFSILEDDSILKFDVISCWDVIEHFEPESIDTFLIQVKKHLKDDGIFIGCIALYDSGTNLPWTDVSNPIENISYHKSIFPIDFWNEIFLKHFELMNYPISTANRSYINPHNDSRYFVFCAKIKN
jgi:SAM-dependent methyltransferase